MSTDKQIRVLLTTAGGVDKANLIARLREEIDNIYIVGVDMNPGAHGRITCDAFYQVERGDHPDYVPNLIQICQDEKVQLVMPCSDEECRTLSLEYNHNWFKSLGIQILVNPQETVQIGFNKLHTIQHLSDHEGINLPETVVLKNIGEFGGILDRMGYNEGKPVILKPNSSHGSRGMRLVSKNADVYKEWLTAKSQINIDAESMKDILSRGADENGDFKDEILIQEYLPGESYNVDLFAANGKIIDICCHRRNSYRWGQLDAGEFHQHPSVMEQCRRISEAFEFDGLYNIELNLREDGEAALVETNPRLSATHSQNRLAGYDQVANAIRYKLGLPYQENDSFEKSGGFIIFETDMFLP